jgi:hypothetical protein
VCGVGSLTVPPGRSADTKYTRFVSGMLCPSKFWVNCLMCSAKVRPIRVLVARRVREFTADHFGVRRRGSHVEDAGEAVLSQHRLEAVSELRRRHAAGIAPLAVLGAREHAHSEAIGLLRLLERLRGRRLLFGSLPDERGRLQTELKRRVKQIGANATTGLGSVFVALADKWLKPGGRLAFVVPAAVASGEAWADTRQLISDRYHLETVVSSQDACKVCLIRVSQVKGSVHRNCSFLLVLANCSQAM